MQCSGCGADISAAGTVCPFCGQDKSDDKRYEWTKFVGGLIGLVIGLTIFDNILVGLFCFFPGYVIGAVVDIVRSGKKAAAPAKPAAAPARELPPQKNDTADKLAQLKAMHEQGLLTDDEYARKKADIIDRF